MEVHGCDLDIGKESVLVEKHRATCHVEPVRETLVVDILNCSLQRDAVSFPRNLLLNSASSSTSRSWIPVVDAESFLYSGAVGQAVVEVIFLRRDVMSSSGCFTELCTCPSNVDRVTFQNSGENCFHPSSKTISYERDIFLIT